jgi:hypothetical protein
MNAPLQLTLDWNQRWLLKRPSYRPPGETIRTRDYDIAEIPDDTTARAFLAQHHYAGNSYPAARFRYGLYHHAQLVGVAVYSHPCNNRVLTNTFPTLPARQAVELGRLALLDQVPGNGESFFVATTFHHLRRRDIYGVISFSDPQPRLTSDGTLCMRGHAGTTYQSLSAIYLGRATPRTLRLLPDGHVLSDRTIQKIRKTERGWLAAAQLLQSYGAPPAPDDPADRLRWLTLALARFTTPLPHRGNHRYAWPLAHFTRALLPASLPYPKHLDPLPTLTFPN